MFQYVSYMIRDCEYTDTQQLSCAISKGGIKLYLYIYALFGKVPNHSFLTSVQLQLNCSNL